MADSHPIPEGLDVVEDRGTAVIRWRWFTHIVWGLLFFCVAWDAFLIFWYSMALGPHKGGHGVPWIMVVFPIGHVAVGVGLTYFMFCLFLNKTDVVLSEARLTVRTHPLPWLGNRVVEPAELAAFSVRFRSGSRNNRGGYSVMYVDRGNKERTLVKGYPNEEQAQYVADALTHFYLPGQKAANPPA